MNKFSYYCVLSLILLMLPLVAIASQTKIVAIKFSGTMSATALNFKLNAKQQPHIFLLSHPDRLILDFKNTTSAINFASLNFHNTNIKKIRKGYPQPNILRLVIDLKRPVHIQTNSKIFSNQLTIKLIANRNATNKSALMLLKAPQNPLFSKNSKKMLLKNFEFKTPTIHIVIDPGHGGKDPGAIGEMGTKEKDVVLAIAKMLAELINQQPQMHAVLTRKGDYFITLKERLIMARKNKADLFISIHADSYFNLHANGASVYSLSAHGATSLAARWLAQRENHSELGGVNLEGLQDQSYLLRSVLIDLAQTVTIKDSLRWGTLMLDSLDEVTRLHYTRVEQAPFMVLKSPDIPSILVETGFISNAKEELRLRNKVYQHRIALALFDGIQRYQKKYAIAGM